MSDNATQNREADDTNRSKDHPPPPLFNPMPSSHATPSHVHSVVPDLMRVYESLTKSNPAAHDDHGSQLPAQSHTGAQHSSAAYYQQQHQPHTQHVNYAYITSEEQYRQLYQLQSSKSHCPIHILQNYPGQVPTSLPYIPAPYDSGNTTQDTRAQDSHQTIQDGELAGPPDKTSSSEESHSRPSSRSSFSRKRNITTEEQEETSLNTSGRPKGRKKAKETDGRWSKRFTWPEELHRDFVSAVFDVGLKHSSPSTILEHMPKHPQITSERIKSHLQKYRLHRTKSKQEFMSSYESTLKKFKAGDMDQVKALSDGEVGAHLTRAVLTDASDLNTTSHALIRETEGSAKQHLSQRSETPQVAAVVLQQQRVAVPPTGHEALMLPKLTETEKSSPIGASMGYLLGLFFSLKKQLLMQRATAELTGPSAESGSALIPMTPTIKYALSSNSTDGPVAAVYNSFVGTPSSPAPSGSNMIPVMHVASPMAPAPIMTATSMDWSSSLSAPPSSGDHSASAATSSGVPNGVLNTGSTRNNLEASNMMKREMQNQMAFQNKMRALKQQELNKYKNVSPNQNSEVGSSGQEQIEPNSQVVRFKQPDGSPYMENNSSRQDHPGNSNYQGGPASPPKEPSHSEVENLVNNDYTHGGSGSIGNDERHENSKVVLPGGDGDATIQGAGETAGAVRARVPSFSMGGNDDFWNADVMDEQLFEFLMNN